jgi:hypothetical protein
MPSLAEQINADLKAAMVRKDATAVSALRMLKAALTNAQIAKKADALSDTEVRAVVQKQIAQGRESIEQYRKGGRADLVGTEEAQAKVIEAYLPQQMDDAALEKTLRELVASGGFASKKDFGNAMKLAQERLQGRAENRRISAVLGRLLT